MEQSHQKRVDVEGSWVTVDVYGDVDGPAIVLIPGVMADAAGWGDVAAGLTGWGTAAVVNRRGRLPSGPVTDSYSLQTEVDDLTAVLAGFSDVRTVFGWSYGGLIGLHLSMTHEVPHVIAYEPIMRPFGAAALDALADADRAHDVDAVVTIALSEVAGLPTPTIEALRADEATWTALRAVSAPLLSETAAINTAPDSHRLGSRAARTSLILGQSDRDRAPYGTTFRDVVARTPGASEHELPGQGHLAHLEAPELLADLVSRLGRQ